MGVLNREAIAEILGPIDDSLAAELVATGASEEDLRTAHAWVVNDEAFVNDMQPYPKGRAAELIDILRQIEGISLDADQR